MYTFNPDDYKADGFEAREDSYFTMEEINAMVEEAESLPEGYPSDEEIRKMAEYYGEA